MSSFGASFRPSSTTSKRRSTKSASSRPATTEGRWTRGSGLGHMRARRKAYPFKTFDGSMSGRKERVAAVERSALVRTSPFAARSDGFFMSQLESHDRFPIQHSRSRWVDEPSYGVNPTTPRGISRIQRQASAYHSHVGTERVYAVQGSALARRVAEKDRRGIARAHARSMIMAERRRQRVEAERRSKFLAARERTVKLKSPTSMMESIRADPFWQDGSLVAPSSPSTPSRPRPAPGRAAPRRKSSFVGASSDDELEDDVNPGDEAVMRNRYPMTYFTSMPDWLHKRADFQETKLPMSKDMFALSKAPGSRRRAEIRQLHTTMLTFERMKELPSNTVALLADQVKLLERVRAGDTIYRKGDPADCGFCVFEGRVRLTDPDFVAEETGESPGSAGGSALPQRAPSRRLRTPGKSRAGSPKALGVATKGPGGSFGFPPRESATESLVTELVEANPDGGAVRARTPAGADLPGPVDVSSPCERAWGVRGATAVAVTDCTLVSVDWKSLMAHRAQHEQIRARDVLDALKGLSVFRHWRRDRLRTFASAFGPLESGEQMLAPGTVLARENQFRGDLLILAQGSLELTKSFRTHQIISLSWESNENVRQRVRRVESRSAPDLLLTEQLFCPACDFTVRAGPKGAKVFALKLTRFGRSFDKQALGLLYEAAVTARKMFVRQLIEGLDYEHDKQRLEVLELSSPRTRGGLRRKAQKAEHFRSRGLLPYKAGGVAITFVPFYDEKQNDSRPGTRSRPATRSVEAEATEPLPEDDEGRQ